MCAYTKGNQQRPSTVSRGHNTDEPCTTYLRIDQVLKPALQAVRHAHTERGSVVVLPRRRIIHALHSVRMLCAGRATCCACVVAPCGCVCAGALR